MSRRYDWLIVGAGFTGATLAARIARERGERVLVIDRRAHIAGNAFDEKDENGILVHRYGPHIFHTNSERIWSFLSGFTTWRPYIHRVRASIGQHLVPIPFNLDSIRMLFPVRQAEAFSTALIDAYGCGERVPILELGSSANEELRALAAFVYDKVFLNYCLKQWELRPEELDPSVTARVPVVVGNDDRYFQDRFQAMPAPGYTTMFERMLGHPNIAVELTTRWRDVRALNLADRIIYTGPLDEFFDCDFGALPYRSVRFEHVVCDKEFYQPVAQVNYPNDFSFTRVTEQKHLTGDKSPRSTLVYEYPCAYVAGENEPYYPLPIPATKAPVRRYLERTRALAGKVWFAGRLADYRYYNMDQACGRALALFDKEIAQL